MRACMHCVVSGRVQGVFYRVATQRKAVALGVDGWVRNLPDGSVEVFAQGAEDALAELRAWLWQGPPRAAVAEVRCRPVVDPEELEGFEVR